MTLRETLLTRYVKAPATGVEIGPLTSAWPTPSNFSVKYVDKLSTVQLKKEWAKETAVSKHKIVPIDIVDNGNYLRTIPDCSFDFYLSSHCLEHMEAFIAAIKNAVRVVKPGGFLFFAVPDMRYTFDKPRQLTLYRHHLDEYLDPTLVDANYRIHHKEFNEVVHHTVLTDARLDEKFLTRGDTHYHTWTHEELLIQLATMESLFGSYKVIESLFNSFESLVVLRKL